MLPQKHTEKSQKSYKLKIISLYKPQKTLWTGHYLEKGSKLFDYVNPKNFSDPTLSPKSDSVKKNPSLCSICVTQYTEEQSEG